MVGGGTAGAVLAARLAAAGPDVLVIEAGPDYGPAAAGRWPADLLDAGSLPTSHDWGYRTTGAGGGTLALDRARVLGGCSPTTAARRTGDGGATMTPGGSAPRAGRRPISSPPSAARARRCGSATTRPTRSSRSRPRSSRPAQGRPPPGGRPRRPRRRRRRGLRSGEHRRRCALEHRVRVPRSGPRSPADPRPDRGGANRAGDRRPDADPLARPPGPSRSVPPRRCCAAARMGRPSCCCGRASATAGRSSAPAPPCAMTSPASAAACRTIPRSSSSSTPAQRSPRASPTSPGAAGSPRSRRS